MNLNVGLQAMKRNLIHSNEVQWVEKRNPQLSADRRGLYKNLTKSHGIDQFEARVTRLHPGESNTWYHRHSSIEEWFYVLHGSCSFCLNGQWMEIGEGDSVATEPGEWHTFRNNSTNICDIIMVGINDSNDEVERSEEPSFDCHKCPTIASSEPPVADA